MELLIVIDLTLKVCIVSRAQLEGQLNAIYNKEEEERIRKEEAAKGDR